MVQLEVRKGLYRPKFRLVPQHYNMHQGIQNLFVFQKKEEDHIFSLSLSLSLSLNLLREKKET
jgi:hypothetical protein